MPILPPTLVAKLDPLIRRLASSHDGEVIAVVRALERRLHAERFDLNDLAETVVGQQAPPLAWHTMHKFCLEHRGLLRARELEFVTNLSNWRGELTPKQRDWLTSIFKRLQHEATA